MKNLLLILTLTFSIHTYSQTIQQIDSLNNQICKSFEKLEPLDQTKLGEALKNHMPNFYSQHKIDSKTKSDSIMDLVYFRLQKNCNSFIVLLSKLEENKSDWKTLNTKPASNIGDSELKKFFLLSNFHYKEYDGKIVKVKINSNLWNEKFEDGSFSELEFKKTSSSTFSLKFLQSNNSSRKNFSTKGEEYNYGIYEKGENFYSIWISSKEEYYYIFKLYID